MAIDVTVFERDVQAIVDDYPATFVYDNKSFQGTFSEFPRDELQAAEGYAQDCDGIIDCLVSSFPNGIIPKIGKEILIKAAKYRVTRTVTDFANIGLTIYVRRIGQ